MRCSHLISWTSFRKFCCLYRTPYVKSSSTQAPKLWAGECFYCQRHLYVSQASNVKYAGEILDQKVMLLEELWLLSGNGDKAPDFTKQEICFFSQNIYQVYKQCIAKDHSARTCSILSALDVIKPCSFPIAPSIWHSHNIQQLLEQFSSGI